MVRLLSLVVPLVILLLWATTLRALLEALTWWSTRSLLQRETFFMSEEGFYYHYYKRIVSDPSLVHALRGVIHDRTVEFPIEINAHRRFNIVPEIVLGTVFRVWQGSHRPIDEAYLLDATDFYVQAAFLIGGLVPAVAFLLAAKLSRRWWGGMLAALLVVANHKSTRIWFATPLRESFGVPILIVQLYCVHLLLFPKVETTAAATVPETTARTDEALAAGTTICASPDAAPDPQTNTAPLSAGADRLAASRITRWPTTSVAILSTSLAVLAWQFSVFLLLIEAGSVCLSFLLHFVSLSRLRHYSRVLVVALFSATILRWLDTATMCSFTFCFALALAWCTHWRSAHRDDTISSRGLFLLKVIVLTMVIRLLLVWSFEERGDNDHIQSLLYHKLFGSSIDFHAMLYLAQDEFRFLPFSDIVALSVSLVLPLAAIALASVTFHLARHYARYHAPGSLATTGMCDPRALGPFVFHSALLLGHTVLAVWFQRLRVIWVPSMAILAGGWTGAASSIFPSSRAPTSSPSGGWAGAAFTFASGSQAASSSPSRERRVRSAVLNLLLGIIVAVVAYHRLSAEVADEREIEFPEKQQLLEWIARETPTSASFAGDMSSMSSVRLVSNRSILNHPQYEDRSLRHRTFIIYHWYAKRDVSEVHSLLKSLHADFFVSDRLLCQPGPPERDLAQIVERGEYAMDGHLVTLGLRHDKMRCCERVATAEPSVGSYFRPVYPLADADREPRRVRDGARWVVYKVQ
eukprot:TRINITY_DN3070_c1_g1_i1.p1 TRINITY_DN3070_c1_g1~~TRINITY_DN3070_c1_g1_i1.p1  ORF type:complete len:749 (-),score=85.28 TRINITY_DN3070_c1_g1_i1:35-2281(-)